MFGDTRPTCAPVIFATTVLVLLTAPGSAAPGGTRSTYGAEAPENRFDLRFTRPDSAVAGELRESLEDGWEHIEEFFEEPFRHAIEVRIAPDRSAFTATFPPEWGLEDTQCWMVATGVAERLAILSPRVWPGDACEHDPADARHVAGIVRHELVHVYHGQHNPTGDFVGAEGLDWFIEGLAVYVSGQLDDGHAADAREALEKGLAPGALADAWSGRYRYGVCGSLVRFLDVTRGRDTLRAMLAATGQDQLLALADLDEQELLDGWRAFVIGTR